MNEETSFFDFVQKHRAGRPIKRPKKIRQSTDKRGWITITNETDRLCIDDKKPTRVLLIADLRKGHPLLKPGILGRTIPNTSDYYRYVGVEFDNGVKEVVSISAVQPVTDKHCKASSTAVLTEIQGTLFDWNDETAQRKTREWEAETFGRSLDLNHVSRGGHGPHEVYAYTFPSLMALAESRRVQHYPVKIGYTGAAGENAPSLTRIDSQLGDSAGRFEPAVVLVVWNSWNGRSLETRVHSHFRSLKRRLESAVGREWYNTNVDELVAYLKDVDEGDVSRVPLHGPVPESFQGFAPPNNVFAESLHVLSCGMAASGMAFVRPIEFDDLLEEAATPEVVHSRRERRDHAHKE